MSEDGKETEKKFRVRVVVSAANDRRNIDFGECDEAQVKEIIGTINSAFGVVRVSQALMLTGSDGVATFVNLDNVTFIEVQVG